MAFFKTHRTETTENSSVSSTTASTQPNSSNGGGKPKRRLLFVDGDPANSNDFNRLLQGRGSGWEILPAKNPAEAISLLEKRPFDCVVASARLPGGSGVDLLNESTRRFPNVVRVIRYAPEDKSLLRGFVGWPPSHLTREMDGAEIENGLEGAFQVAAWLSNPALKKLLPQAQKLPTVPEIYDRVMALLNSPNASIEDVGNLIAQDPALTVKMLQIVNSAAFALAHPVTSAVEAVMVLGTERTKALILVANTSLHFNLSACKGFSQDQFWRHSLATSALARNIVRMETKDPKLADQAFTTGLLHDLGKLIFAANFTSRYSEMLGVARNQKISDCEAERLQFGTTHAELGACLLGTWGLPLEMVRAIASHHAPAVSGEGRFSLLTAVHVANALEHNQNGGGEATTMSKLDRVYLTRLGLNDRYMRWRELVNGQALAA